MLRNPSYIEYIMKEPGKDRGRALKIRQTSNSYENNDGDTSGNSLFQAEYPGRSLYAYDRIIVSVAGSLLCT